MELLFLIVLICLPLALLSWVLPERRQLLPLGLGTVVFLGIQAPVSLMILTLTGLATFFLLRIIPKLWVATLMVVVQLTAIFLFFKLQYGISYEIIDNRIIPLGLSFYSFRQIHYALEVYKRTLPAHSVWQYLQYLFFLPTFLVGPINRFPVFLRDMARRRWDPALFSAGLERILYGFAKIVILGNYVFTAKMGKLVTNFQDTHPWLANYLDILKFSGNAYVQFAGFSDVAIGLSLLFGFRVMENFNYPFLATNIVDFWSRWHISLSDWCRDYVYYPFLGITRSGWISIIASMLVLGGWHEISLRYLVWGGVHALAINVWHQYKQTGLAVYLSGFPRLQKVAGNFITIHFVMLSFVLIKEKHWAEAFEVYLRFFGLN